MGSDGRAPQRVPKGSGPGEEGRGRMIARRNLDVSEKWQREGRGGDEFTTEEKKENMEGKAKEGQGVQEWQNGTPPPPIAVWVFLTLLHIHTKIIRSFALLRAQYSTTHPPGRMGSVRHCSR